MPKYTLSARISTDGPDAVRPVLVQLFKGGSIKETGESEFEIRAEMEGASARALNREVLSALRRAEKKTRLRAEWTRGRSTEKFFDYVPKGTRTS